MAKKQHQKIPGGFVMMPKWVFTHSHLGVVDHEIYMALAFFADNKTRTCWPSVNAIMAYSKISTRKTVQNSLKRLELTGCIEVNRRNGYANIYYLPKKPVAPKIDEGADE